jgi:hypothetical protein
MRGCIPRSLSIWLLVAALVPALPAASLAGGLRVKGPVIRFDPSIIDMGTLAQGEIRNYEVSVHNDGTETLEISDVESDCGCTVAQLPDSSISPGGHSLLKVAVQTRTMSGNVSKRVTLTTNDPAAPKASLAIKAFVRVQVTVNPTSIEFGPVPIGEARRQTITLKAALSDTLRIRSLDFPSKLVTTTVEQGAEGDSTVYRVNVDLKRDATPGPFSVNAEIVTNQKVAFDHSIRLTGQVHGFFQVAPEAVSLGQVRQGTAKSASVTLTGTAPGAYHVTAATTSDPLLTAEVVTLEAGRVYEVRVTLLPNAPAGRITGELWIATDDPRQPRIELDVRGNVRRAAG